MKNSKLKDNIIEFVKSIDKKRIDGKSIDDIRYDGIPIWWFFKTKFLGGRLPFQSPKHKRLVDAILSKREITFYDRLKNRLKAYLFAKSIRYNEELKIFISRFNNKRSRMATGKKNIMVLAHTNAIMFNNSEADFEVDRIESVVKKIREDDGLQEYISIVDPISHNSLLNLLKYENLVYRYMDKKSRRNAIRNASKLHRQWKELRNKFQYDSKIDKEIYSHLQPTLDFVFSKEMIYFAILYYEAYKKIIRENDIKLLLSYAPSGIISRCAVMAADKLGVKTLHISHGTGQVSSNPQLPDSVYHAVIGEKYKENYITVGIPPELVFITGPIFMDDIVGYKKERNHVDNNIKNILFLTWPIKEYMENKKYIQYIKKYLQELNKVGDVDITIKLHPRERSTKLYESIVNSLGHKNIKIIKTVGKTQTKDFLYSMIRDSDLVISFGSTSSVESLVIGTPTLIIDLLGFPQDPIMTEGIIHVKRDEDISGIVAEMLYDKKKIADAMEKGNQAISKYLYKVDGKANERVLNIIKRLMV